MKLGIPTLVNYHGLDRLIASAERGTVKPTGYIIIDNGGLYAGLPELRGRTEIVRPGRNIGVAASWNRILEMAESEPIVISNDDILLGERIFAEMQADVTRHPIVVSGWCLFAQSPECTRAVGFYDENFWPACYEDSDYAVRMARAQVTRSWNISEPVQHSGCWTTSRLLGDPEWLTSGIERCRQYFVRKWGGTPSDTNDGLYELPFNGAPPTGWSLRP
jgi:GT2 family glycosyltransferase